jgi:hypothetical protein
MKQEDQSGIGSGTTASQPGNQQIDGRYGEEPHVITDRLRSTMANAAQGDFVVLGKKQDGSPFLWSTGDQAVAKDLAKSFAGELTGLRQDA